MKIGVERLGQTVARSMVKRNCSRGGYIVYTRSDTGNVYVLLGRVVNSNGTPTDRYSDFGGHSYLGEELWKTAERELDEELGWMPLGDSTKPPITLPRLNTRCKMGLECFLEVPSCIMDDIVEQFTPTDEVCSVAWFPYTQLLDWAHKRHPATHNGMRLTEATCVIIRVCRERLTTC